MKSASGTLQAYLMNNSVYQMADLVTVTPVSGSSIYLTSADIDISDGTNTFTHGVYGYKRSNTRIQLGLNVDEMDITLWDLGTNLINGHSLYESCLNGYFDNAQVKVERLFNYASGYSANYKVWMFQGNVSDSNPTRNAIHLKIKSELEKLNLPTPRNIYQPTCINTLYDVTCGVTKATFTKTGAVTTLGTNVKTSFNATLSSYPATNGYYDLGVVTFTSGANNGVSRAIKSHTGTSNPVTINLSTPTPYAIAASDAFSIVPGCDKIYSSGCTKFANTSRFRGFDFIPRNEDAQ